MTPPNTIGNGSAAGERREGARCTGYQPIAKVPDPFGAAAKPAASTLKVVSVPDLIQMDVADREMILHRFLPTQGLAMLYSKRGVGKTFIALGISIAVASGSRFFKRSAPAPRRILYLDGEMPLSSLKQRVVDIGAGFDIPAPLDNLRIITPDLQDGGLPDLSTISGQD